MRRWIVVLAVFALVISALFGALQLANARTFRFFGDLVARVDTDRAVVALTFDDGPTNDYTQPVLDILKAHDVRATFFLTGRETAENPQEAKAIADAGHEVGNHSWSHNRLILVGPTTVREEIESTDAAIRTTGYQGELHFRPPYGKKLLTLPWYLAQNDRTTIMWDVEPEAESMAAADPQAMADYVIANATNGSIIIMHVMYESRETSRQALPALINGLRARGLEFVTVSELLALRHSQDASG
jgi:peptidoglycan/xylan/chitin deacetylase (PgdA/CDA1 family)